MLRFSKILFPLISCLLLASAASGAPIPLEPRSGGLAFYDPNLGITWMSHGSLATLTTFGLPTGVSLGTHPSDGSGQNAIINADGSMNWPAALFWFDAMNAANFLGVSDWRLPSADVNGDSTVVDCSGGGVPGCADNEMGFLFWEEGVTGFAPVPFTGVQTSVYWSGTETNPGSAWWFSFGFGQQLAVSKWQTLHVWAARSGDIAAIPVPAGVWLFGSAIGLLGWMRRRGA